MTISTPHLPLLLTREAEWHPQLDQARSEKLTSAARFWIPQKPPTTIATCRAALTRLFENPTEMAQRLPALSAREQAILAIIKRYGGAMSGTILRTELLVRKLLTLQETRDGYRSYSSLNDAPFTKLENKFLVARFGHHNPYNYYSYGSEAWYPDLVANPAGLISITAAEPAPWFPDCPAPPPSAVTSGSFAEFVLNLWIVAQELARNNGWKPNRAGNIPKTLINKLRKILPPTSTEIPSTPDLPALYCEMLKGLGVVSITNEVGSVDLNQIQRILSANTEPLAHLLTGVWLFVTFWQDGAGALNEHYADNRSNKLLETREQLAWALGALARGVDGWFDLVSFLNQLWNIHQGESPRIYASNYHWIPAFARTQLDAKATTVDRNRKLWLDDTGVCFANALLGTLVHLGLVERGPVTDQGPLAFRLTTLGRVVFGAPEVACVFLSAPESRFFTLQPNFDVIASIDNVPPRTFLPLARFARRTSGHGGRVQTFTIDRALVYQAMESGFTLEQIREYLTAHSRNTPPPNVIRTLEEWGGKRDSLVLRRGVSLMVGSASPPNSARAVGEGFHLLDGSAMLPKDMPSVTNPDCASPCTIVNENGKVRLLPNTDLVAIVRLRQLAETAADGELTITKESVAAAKRHGLSVEQFLNRLRHYHRGPVPPVLEVAIRNWSVGGGQVKLGSLLMLKVFDAAIASAILQSERFKPFIVHHIPPEWFVVKATHRKELEKLLTSIGFTWTADE